MEQKWRADYYLLVYKVIVNVIIQIDDNTRLFALNCVKNYLDCTILRTKIFMKNWGSYESTNSQNAQTIRTPSYYGNLRIKYPEYTRCLLVRQVFRCLKW